MTSPKSVKGGTPGPWEISEATGISNGGLVEHLVVAGEGHAFGLVAAFTYREDAILGAAAPQLLEALQTIISLHENADRYVGYSKLQEAAHKAARSAIAAATATGEA